MRPDRCQHERGKCGARITQPVRSPEAERSPSVDRLPEQRDDNSRGDVGEQKRGAEQPSAPVVPIPVDRERRCQRERDRNRDVQRVQCGIPERVPGQRIAQQCAHICGAREVDRVQRRTDREDRHVKRRGSHESPRNRGFSEAAGGRPLRPTQEQDRHRPEQRTRQQQQQPSRRLELGGHRPELDPATGTDQHRHDGAPLAIHSHPTRCGFRGLP